MNPWQSLRREIDGVFRSIRYDLAVRKARKSMDRVMTEDTVVLPVLGPRPTPDRRRMYAAVAAVLLPVAGVSGYLAVTNGLGALLPGDGSPNGLPGTAVDERRPSQGPGQPGPQAPGDPAAARPGIPDQLGQPARTSPGASPTLSPPVPTPAPTCNCPTPSPSPTVSPTPSPSVPPSPSPKPPQPSPSPTVTTGSTSGATR